MDSPPRECARAALCNLRLGRLIEIMSNARSRDVRGRGYGHFLPHFASAKGSDVYPRCYGSLGMFAQSVQLVRAPASCKTNASLSIRGQESNSTTRCLAKASGEDETRKNLTGGYLVDWMVPPPGPILYSTQIPAHLAFLTRRRPPAGEVPFLIARKLSRMVDRTHRELTGDDIARIAGICHAWSDGATDSEDRSGFCKRGLPDEVRRHGRTPTPSCHFGEEPQPANGEPFQAKIGWLIGELPAQQAQGARPYADIAGNLKALGFGSKVS